METVNNLFISIQFLSKLIVPAVLHSFWSTIRKEEKTEVKKKQTTVAPGCHVMQPSLRHNVVIRSQLASTGSFTALRDRKTRPEVLRC